MTDRPRLGEDPRPVVAVFRSTVFHAGERFVQRQAAGLSRYQPLVFGLARGAPPIAALEGRILTPLGPAAAFLQRLTGRAGPWPEILRPYAPVLVHAHFAPDGLMALPIARALGTPLVTSLRGYDVNVYPARMLASGRLTWMRYALLGSRLRREGDLFLAVSEGLRRQAIARGFPEARTFTHYNGVDLGRFRPDPAAAEPGLVLHVGRLVEKKGTAGLLRAFAGLARERPQARLAVIGEGPLSPSLKALAAALGLADRVRFLGPLPHEQVDGWMRRAWVLAAPSVTAGDGDAEGLPNVLVEAAASGLPAVGTRHAGIPETIEDGETGLVVPERDEPALAQALGGILDSADLRGRLAAAARSLAESRFDAERQARRLEAHYDRLLAARRGEG